VHAKVTFSHYNMQKKTIKTPIFAS